MIDVGRGRGREIGIRIRNKNKNIKTAKAKVKVEGGLGEGAFTSLANQKVALGRLDVKCEI